MEIDQLLLDSISEQIGPQLFGRWFASSIRFDLNGETLCVQTASPFIGKWINTNYRQNILKACRDRLGREYPLEFSVGSFPDEPLEQSAPNTADESVELRNDSVSASARKMPNGGAQRAMASYRDFVEGLSNRVAKRALDIVIESPGALNPIFLYGPTSVGKTHLLEGVYGEYRAMPNRRSPLYFTAEQFTTRFTQQFRPGNRDDRSFRSLFRDISLLVIDDLHFLKGKESTQIELIALFDRLRRDNIQMIFSADRPLADLTELRSELLSRLEAGFVCDLKSAERETLLEIFRRIPSKNALVGQATKSCLPD